MVNYKWLVHRSDTNQETEALNIPDWQNRVNPVTLKLTEAIDAARREIFKLAFPAGSGGGPPPPPVNLPPVIQTQASVTGKVNQEVTLTATITDPDDVLEDVNFLQTGGPVTVTDTETSEAGGIYKAKFTPPQAGTYTFIVEAFDTRNARSEQQIAVVVDTIVIPPPTGDVLYDSHIHSKLHDGKKRTIKQEGTIAPNGLGVECRASGNPRIQVNEDGTFSLLCDKGHGRLYFYVLNYNAKMELEWAFWNSASGQDNSLKMRSRHNESGKTCDGGSPIDGNRFGGYGLAIDRSGWGAKREPTHNCHDQSKSGSTPVKPDTKKFVKTVFTVKDVSGKVNQLGAIDGQQFMNKTDDSPKPFMVDVALYGKQSYVWIRQNIDSGTGELRIKSLRILKA